MITVLDNHNVPYIGSLCQLNLWPKSIEFRVLAQTNACIQHECQSVLVWHCTARDRRVPCQCEHKKLGVRAQRFPLPDGLGQVKLPVRQVDLNRFFLFILYKQSGTKPNLVAKILATNFGVFFPIHVMFSKICSMWV